ncbi:chitinase C-terminal domain-containing protein [Allokutzneria sp. NRRL B-24872]|uniref:chitinase C-terminal domain-containing protein n=1 Tax=Allokutzneria sp. NRRL B-24872 TaxID=1137961 RepID=UPI000A38C9DB
MARRTAVGAAVVALLSGLLVAVVNSPAASAANEDCRPDGLSRTGGVDTPYCLNYDTDGREKMGAANRRVIGYFTGWRHGKNNQPAYLVNNIPWNNITHINYAFAHVDPQNRISVGAQNANNPATGMEWPGVAGAEMDPALPYKGHFNLLTKYKKQNPAVKTLISVGGWAETGGYINEAGDRVNSGGFYSMTTNADNSVNTAGINAFADSTVQFLRTYGFNGVDIDYEYPTSNADAGNPLDFQLANARRAGLNRSYQVLMKTLREKLDAAAASDGKYYMLTVAAPASGWLLRGMEVSQTTQHLDYVNIMSYDLHGAWNKFVGPNASLFDDGKDAELAAGGVYGAPHYGGIGYLNTDWAYHYFRGGVQSGRINIGVPFYSRGHRNVVGGTNGLWGTAVGSNCPQGLTACGDGAKGIDNIWHDKENGRELGAGSNPLWHTKNLERGIAGSYIGQYGLDPATDPEDRLTGTYTPHYDSTLTAPWLWNNDKKVFLSTEDERSIGAKADYVASRGIGGIMIWELAGDYAWNAAKGENYIGNTLTTTIKQKFAAAGPYGNKKSPQASPAERLDVKVDFVEFPLGDNNYPISPKMRITNASTQTIPGGAELQFDYPTSAPPSMAQQSGWTLSVIRSDHTGPNNIGGLKGDFHRVSMKLPSWQNLAPGATADVALSYQLPISGPSNYTITFGGKTYGITQDYARGGGTTPPPTTTTTTTSKPPTCTDAPWERAKSYGGGNTVSHAGQRWRAKWWTQGEEPGTTGQWGVWETLGSC